MSKIKILLSILIILVSNINALIEKEANCNSGQFADGDKCSFCPQGCKTCYSLDICLSCMEGYRWENNRCEKCDIEHCKVCRDSKDTCNECFNEFYLSGNSSCIPCSEYCHYCESSTCIECKPGSYLDEGKCKKCNIKNCIECLDSSTCERCATGYSLNANGKCQKCTDILANCLTCDFYQHSCLSCNDGLYYNQNQKKCLPCKDTNCRKCRGDEGEDCYECYKGFGGDTCEIKCEENCDQCESYGCITCSDFYYFNLNGGCDRCNEDCFSCQGGICYESDLKCDDYEYYDPDYKMCVIKGDGSYLTFSLLLLLVIFILY